MGIVFRQSVKTTIVTSLGAALGLLIVYLSAHFIPKQELGCSRNLLYQAVIGTQFVLIGMQSTLYVFIPRYAVHDKRRHLLLSLGLIIPFILTGLLSVLYFLFKAQIIASYQAQDTLLLTKYFAWLPLYTLLWSLITLLEQYLSAQMKVAISTFVREIVLRIFNIILILLYANTQINFNQFIIWGVCVHIIPVIIMFIIAAKTEGFGLSLNFKLISKGEYKSIFDFAFFHLFLNITISLLTYIDAVMLGALDRSGLQAVAVYFIAQSIISIYIIPFRSLAAASTPAINKAYHEENTHEVHDLFTRSSLNTLIVTICMAVLIICNLQNAVLILGDNYSAVKPVVMILMIGRTFDMMTGLNNEVISISKYYRVNFYISVVLVVIIIILNALLIPHWGIYGAAWGSSFALFLFNLGKWLFLKNKMQLQPFSINTLKVISAGIMATLAGCFLPYLFNPIVDTIIRSIVILTIYGIAILYINPSKDLKEYLLSVKKNKRLF
jgi:O-antigen/teichoic acid export membrane protein